MRSGYVYVLSNPSMPGQVKVGWSAYGGGYRAEQLSKSTGMPTPFVLRFEITANNAERAEKLVHKDLAEFRLNPRREFFTCPVEVAILAILRRAVTVYQGIVDDIFIGADEPEIVPEPEPIEEPKPPTEEERKASIDCLKGLMEMLREDA